MIVNFRSRAIHLGIYGLAWAVTSGVVVGCASPTPVASTAVASPREPSLEIASVRARRCGQCHMLPEPKTHTREELENAFVRHRRRVRLSDDQWDKMVDYLAQDDSR